MFCSKCHKVIEITKLSFVFSRYKEVESGRSEFEKTLRNISLLSNKKYEQSKFTVVLEFKSNLGFSQILASVTKEMN